MDQVADRVVAFYSRHPISARHVVAKLRQARGSLDGLTPGDLFDHDQDHYGGLAANDALAAAAAIGPGSRVVDFCAGLGGPARYLAHRFGATVVGVELTPDRVAGANELSALVGMADKVRVVEGDVAMAPLATGSADAVVSQEALLHVPAKDRALAEALRILRGGGRLAFTDWILRRPISAADRAALEQGIAVAGIETEAGYRAKLRQAGFAGVSMADLTAEWGPILDRRFAMYRALREEASKAGTPSGDEAFYASYARLVALVLEGALGGGRFAATRP